MQPVVHCRFTLALPVVYRAGNKLVRLVCLNIRRQYRTVAVLVLARGSVPRTLSKLRSQIKSFPLLVLNSVPLLLLLGVGYHLVHSHLEELLYVLVQACHFRDILY